jgi:hypothetical protein
MKTFDEAWDELGYDFGNDALENVKLGWELCIKSLPKVHTINLEGLSRKEQYKIIESVRNGTYIMPNLGE